MAYQRALGVEQAATEKSRKMGNLVQEAEKTMLNADRPKQILYNPDPTFQLFRDPKEILRELIRPVRDPKMFKWTKTKQLLDDCIASFEGNALSIKIVYLNIFIR